MSIVSLVAHRPCAAAQGPMNGVTRSDARPTAAPPARRRRRPSGEAPPLPRHIGATGRAWLLTSAVAVAWLLASIHLAWVQRLTDRADAAVLRALAGLRTSWLTPAARGVDRVATGWTMFVVAMLLVLVSIVWKRWRHLFAFLGSVVVLRLIGLALHAAHRRPRPYDVTTIGTWNGYSSPSATSAIVSIAVIGVIYMVVVPGRPRSIAKIAGGVVIALVAGARLYLAVDHPFDVIAGVALGVTVPLLAFRYFAPSEVVPVSYDGGKKAHLDITGRRGDALRRAVEDQLGAIVTEVRPVGLAGSGGSTPLRLRLAGDPETFVFGKLYALNHVRSDRWYKLGRTVLYGGLEDEAPFPTVRRLVQYEDYALRLMRDAGIATAAPLGIVELTPEREYMLVTEFMDGAEEIGDAEIDDQIIDEGLALVRRLWDAGLAHRDIKPANLLVVDGHLVVIDVAFAQVRPSPWRQAVDLANMMLVLAVRTDAPRVYDRALTYFSPDEIAEAFAAARGVASPSQLRSVLKRDGRDLVAEFRLLGPARAPISLQRWGPRRVVLAAAIAAFGVIAAINVVSMVAPAELPMTDTPTCGTNNTMILMAQAVPSAHAIPCVDALPPGWSIGGVSVRAADARFWLDSDRYGSHAVQIGLRSADRCLVERKRRAQPHHPWLATIRVRSVGAQWPTDPHVRVRYSVHHLRVRSRHRRSHDRHPRQRPRAPTSHRARRRGPPPLGARALRGRVVGMHG